MTKVDIRRLDSVTTNDTTATQLINENFTALQEAIENTISRDGTTPNFMDADLDLNSYKIINAGTPTNNTDVITKEYFDQYVGDAPGYAAAAEQAANRASTSAQAAQGYSNVATGAANIAQAARDFIESDPGFQVVSEDLLLGEDSEIHKVNANKTNIDTVAGSISNVNAVSADISNVNAVAGDLTNVDNIVTNMTDINNIADDLIKIVAVADDLTNIDNVADDLTKIDNVADDLTNIGAVADNITNVNAVANNETNINAVDANKTNIDTVATNIADVNSVATDIAKVAAVADDLTNIDAAVANATNINTVAGDITNINAVAADLTNIDAASDYAAEAKQWAIGDPTEPADGSAKYWAGQAAAGQVQADWTEADTSSKTYIRNKPTVDASPTQYSTNLVQSGGVFTSVNGLQNQIDAIVASSDVFDIVGTYTELQAYDISTVPVNDIIKVLVDSTHNDAATYYRCTESGGVKSWSYVGAEGAYYTKSEANTLLNDKANISLSNLSSAGQAVLDAKQDVATAVNYDNITNCITEIPQDIKLELNNGTLTLKAGSKVYVPNGFESDGTTKKFDVVTIASDTSMYAWGSITSYCMITHIPEGNIIPELPSNIYSGTTAPSGTTYMWWYDTTNNVVKRTADGGSTWISGSSLPLCYCYASNGAISSINQVFNGFGYIGSTVFALPGVKGLIPNGRNADGTLKNEVLEIDSVRVITFPNTANGSRYLSLQKGVSDVAYSVAYYEQDTAPNTSTTGTLWRNTETNYLYVYTTTGWGLRKRFGIASCDVTSGKINSFAPKTAFHALDYNDKSTISGWSAPSSKYIDLTLGASGASYTAPANGWFYISKASGANSQYLTMGGNGVYTRANVATSGHFAVEYVPCIKGSSISVSYNLSGATNAFRFIYAEGENV